MRTTTDVKSAEDILRVAEAPMMGHTASRDIAEALISNIREGSRDLTQQRMLGVAEFLRNLADAIDDGTLVA